MPRRLQHSLLGLILVLYLASSMGCQPRPPDRSDPAAQLVNYEIGINDLPPGWKLTSDFWTIEDFEGQSHVVAYGIDSEKNLKLVQTLFFYPDETHAKAAFPQLYATWFPSAWGKWPGANFIPSNPKDQYRFVCQNQEFADPILTCISLQMHKQFISLVDANMNPQSLTLAQLDGVLKAVDDRLNKIEFK